MLFSCTTLKFKSLVITQLCYFGLVFSGVKSNNKSLRFWEVVKALIQAALVLMS